MKILVHHNFCKVDATREEFQWLRELLTVDVPGAKFTKMFKRRQWDGRKRFLNWTAKNFPIGLLGYVLKNKGVQKIEVIETRKFRTFDKSVPELVGMELRDYQKKSVLECINHKNCIIQAATNAGKTAIFAGVIKKLQPMNVLILIHRGEILWQIKKMVESLTGIEVGVITAADMLIKPVTIAMVATLTNRLGADQEITDYFNSVECVIIDEVHHASNATLTSLLSMVPATYRFGFSGTVSEENTLHGMEVRQWIGSVVFEVSNEFLIEEGISARPEVIFYDIDVKERLHNVFAFAKEELDNSGKQYNQQQLLKKVYQLSVQKGIVENTERNGKVLEILKANPGKSTLIVVDLLEHGRIVEKMLQVSDIKAVFISGSSEVRQSALEKFKAGKLKVLISTNIIDEGVDIARIEVLIMLAGKKSKRQLLQRVGRSLRRKEGENTVRIYDFLDFGNRYLENHSKLRYGIYKKEKFDIKHMD